MREPYYCSKDGRNKGAWTHQEDQKLIDYIKLHGEGCWRSLSMAAGLDRCRKSCRLRWLNYLRPDIKRGNFAQDEEDLIIKLHALLGNRWSLIAGRLPGRTDNEVKNYWNSCLRKKLICMGIDPNNHKLYHHLPHQKIPQQPLGSPIAISSESNKNNSNACSSKPSLKSHGTNATNNDDDMNTEKNYAIACTGEETSPMLDLNLKLAFEMP
ncbi:transcription factor MYB3-like [Chenopodium quinoa]|uniref:Uncharacterized protein n=1 Tax=Chenopodium quinoa TaxID=63459 RepID=A0A803M469_CHEQI|nr:transcription factor MYB3-like [Chenopodium quinoa]